MKPKEDKQFLIISLFWFISLLIFLWITRLNRSDPIFIQALIIVILSYSASIYFVLKSSFEWNQYKSRLFWLLTILSRFVVLFIPIGLSDDVYRYVWDGIVQKNGINPFLYAPNDPALVHLRDDWFYLINNPEIHTPYPAFSQITFYLIGILNLDVWQTIFVYRIFFALLDILLILVLYQLLTMFNIQKKQIIVYAWAPLTIFEISGNAHNDILASLFLVSSIYFSMKYTNWKKYVAPVLLSLGIWTKYYPLIALPFLLLYWNKKQLGTFLITLVGLPLIYFNQGTTNPYVPMGQSLYLRFFRFNEGIFKISYLLEMILDDAVVILSVINGLVLILVLIKQILPIYTKEVEKKDLVIIRGIAILLFTGLLIGGNVQPWYLLWVLPFIVLSVEYSVIYFSLAVLYSYQIYIVYDRTGTWMENPFILLFEYIPLYILMIYRYKKGIFFQLGNNDSTKLKNTDEIKLGW